MADLGVSVGQTSAFLAISKLQGLRDTEAAFHDSVRRSGGRRRSLLLTFWECTDFIGQSSFFCLTSSAPLHFFEADSLSLWGQRDIRPEEKCALHRGTDGAADETIQPVVVGLFGSCFPFVNGSSPPLGFYEVFGRHLFAEHAVLFGSVAEDGYRRGIGRTIGQSGSLKAGYQAISSSIPCDASWRGDS